MNLTLDYLRGHRRWLVKNFQVWGEYIPTGSNYLLTETESGGNRVIFGSSDLGGAVQDVAYSSLTDVNGNNLPADIDGAKVVVLPKSSVFCFIVGQENSSGFRIARADTSEVGVVDLLVLEL